MFGSVHFYDWVTYHLALKWGRSYILPALTRTPGKRLRPDSEGEARADQLTTNGRSKVHVLLLSIIIFVNKFRLSETTLE